MKKLFNADGGADDSAFADFCAMLEGGSPVLVPPADTYIRELRPILREELLSGNERRALIRLNDLMKSALSRGEEMELICLITMDRAECMMKLGRKNDALTEYRAAAGISARLGIGELIAECSVGLAECCISLSLENEAKNALETARRVLPENADEAIAIRINAARASMDGAASSSGSAKMSPLFPIDILRRFAKNNAEKKDGETSEKLFPFEEYSNFADGEKAAGIRSVDETEYFLELAKTDVLGREPSVTAEFIKRVEAARDAGDSDRAKRLLNTTVACTDERFRLIITAESASLMADDGEKAASAMLYGTTLEKMREVFGENDPVTVEVTSALAALWGELGDPSKEAELLKRLALAQPNDTDILDRLAQAELESGDTDGAIDTLKNRIAIESDDIDARRLAAKKLVRLLERTGDLDGAERLCERLYSGADSGYNELAAAARLVAICVRTGNIGRAFEILSAYGGELYDAAGDDVSNAAGEVFGALKSSDDVASAEVICRVYADMLRRAGDEEGYKNAMRELLSLAETAEKAEEAVMPPDEDEHPSIAHTYAFDIQPQSSKAFDIGKVELNEIKATAEELAKAGDYRAALSLREMILDTRRATLGDRHPDTLAAMNSVAKLLALLGDHDRAIGLRRMAYIGYREKMGSEHPYTLIVMSNLASTLMRAERYPEELELRRELYEIRKRVLGAGDPETKKARKALARAQERAENS